VTLGPGARVAYRIEARDRDAVSGREGGDLAHPLLVIQNPRENLDEQLARQREILDKLLGDPGRSPRARGRRRGKRQPAPPIR
jgi:hypothetical protein